MRILIAVLFSIIVGFYSDGAVAKSDPSERVLETNEVLEIVNNTIAIIDSEYLFEDKASDITDVLRTSLKSGDFDRAYTFGRLRQQLEVALYRASGDSNFELRQRAGFGSGLSAWSEDSGGVIESGMLEDKVGYIALDGDVNYTSAQADLHRAVQALANAQAIIIDLQRVGLGSLTLTQQLLSYFLPPGTPLADIHFAKGKTQHLLGEVSPDMFRFSSETPVFVVNSAFVTGPWELFGYTLKHYGRAAVVGDKTMGVAVMTALAPVSDNVRLRFSHAYLAHPLSQDNWQDWGVEPDYETGATQDSFTTALTLAQQSLSKSK